MTQTMRYDAIVIGTGRSGPSLAGQLATAGMQVAVIERNWFGGTCVNGGCIQTKTLVAVHVLPTWPGVAPISASRSVARSRWG